MPTIAPPCPRCNKSTDPLAREGDLQRFQCAACSNVFTGPALDVQEPEPAPPAVPGVSHLAVLPPDPHDEPPRPITPPPPPPSTADGAVSPTGESVKARCPKCTRPYFRLGTRFDEHVAKCDGTPPPPAPAPRMPAPQAPRKAVEGPPSTFTPTPETGKALDLSIAALEARKADLQKEILDLDSAIATLRKLRGGESPAGPFAHGE